VIVGGSQKGRVLPFPFGGPSWSGDGTHLVFTGIERSGNTSANFDLYAAAADGSDVIRLPGTADGLSAVVSPDGGTVAFAREREWDAKKPGEHGSTEARSVSIWLLDIDRGATSQLTPWRAGLSAYPSSFSPDGSILAISRQRGNRHAAVAIRLDGSGETVLAPNASEPVYSPDGTRLVMTILGKRRSIGRKGETLTFSPTDLAVAATDGSGLTRLTRTRNLELDPSWDPSGQRIAYTLLTPSLGEDLFFGADNPIMEINTDGSCRTKVLSLPKVTIFGVTWQPGPGREAGPIVCSRSEG